MTKQPTVSDIARIAQVSPSTVSRVLTGSSPVHPAKSAAVLAAIERLNFRPNLTARALARGKSMVVGILTQSMASQFYGELAQGIEDGLANSGYQCVFASGHWEPSSEKAALDLLLARQVDGLIVLGGEHPDAALRTLSTQIPVIAVGRQIEGLTANCLRVANVEGSRQAVQHLIDLGHRRIAHVSGISNHFDAYERREGYEQALRTAGLPLDERLIVEGSFTEQSGMLALETLLARGAPFSAIFAANDQMAYGVRLGLYRRGLRVPEEVSLIGFDDLLGSAYTTPPLTTVRQHMLDQGRAAAQGLLRLLADQPPELRAVRTELVIRESTARVRG
ncbi:MAG: LacI family DNA-binding transcriptional regulator [Oscillochloridaceae bacterium umkhey_bin13]